MCVQIITESREVYHLPALREVLVGIIEVKVACFAYEPLTAPAPLATPPCFLVCYYCAAAALLAEQSLQYHSPLGATLRPAHL